MTRLSAIASGALSRPLERSLASTQFVDLCPTEAAVRPHATLTSRKSIIGMLIFLRAVWKIWSAPSRTAMRAKVISRRKISRIRCQEGFEKRFRRCVIALAERAHGLRLNLLLLRSEIRKRKEQQRDQPFHEPLYTVAVVDFNCPSDLNKAGHLFSVRGKCGEGLFLDLSSWPRSPHTRHRFVANCQKNKKKKLFLKAREDIQPVPKASRHSATETEGRAHHPSSDTNSHAALTNATPASRPNPRQNPRDTAPDAESNARAARKTAAEARRFLLRSRPHPT